MSARATAAGSSPSAARRPLGRQTLAGPWLRTQGGTGCEEARHRNAGGSCLLPSLPLGARLPCGEQTPWRTDHTTQGGLRFSGSMTARQFNLLQKFPQDLRVTACCRVVHGPGDWRRTWQGPELMHNSHALPHTLRAQTSAPIRVSKILLAALGLQIGRTFERFPSNRQMHTILH